MLNVNYEYRKGILFIRLYGQITKDNLNNIKNEIITIIDKSGVTNIVFNLKNIIRIDNYGLKEIYDIYQKIKKKGIIYFCDSDSKIVNSILKQNSFYGFMNFIETEVKAFNLIKI